MKPRRTWYGWVPVLAAVLAPQGASSAPIKHEQAVLGPGLYVFQTRTLDAACGDAERTGFVNSFVAAVDGIPGDRELEMSLVNSKYWPRWSLRVRPPGWVLGRAGLRGDASPNPGVSEFSVKREGARFVGVGTRSYNTRVDGRPARCQVRYEALLRRFDR